MRAFVRLVSMSGESFELGHGDVIGRLWSAALCVHDPRVSEMHAMVSLRGSSLRLLPLRGRVLVDEAATVDSKLEVGQVIRLADDLTFEVAEVHLPDEVMGLEGEGLPRQVLPNVASLKVGARVELVAGQHAKADAVLWSDGLNWFVRGDGWEVGIVAGQTFEVAGRKFMACALALSDSGVAATLAKGGLGAPLHLVLRYDTAHLQSGDDPPIVIDGIAARVLGELVAINKPIGWEALAREIWRDEHETPQLRKRWDVTMVRLRKKLRDARIRTDLVRADGAGNVELWLHRGDTLDDQT